MAVLSLVSDVYQEARNMSRIPMRLARRAVNEQLRWLRLSLRETQSEFWARFGITQSQGSRIEQGGCMPAPLAILLALYLDMHISEVDLATARRRVSLFGRNQPGRDGFDDRLLARADIELAHDVRQVEVDGGFRAAQDA
jgi:transcriptional regulator with XRE-family HTH domain